MSSHGGYSNGVVSPASDQPSTGSDNTDNVLDGWVALDSENLGTMNSACETPATSLLAEVALANDSSVTETSQLLAVLSVVAPPANGMERAALRLNAVIDKSGSMRGEKLRLVKQTMLYMLQHLSSRDALGIIEYDTNVNVAAPMTYCDANGRAKLERALQRLQAGTQTNLSGGLLRGLEMHEDGPRKESDAQPLQKFTFGNTRRELSEDEETESESSPTTKNRHEWTLEFRFEDPGDAALVKKVVYTLHNTFREPVVEVSEGPEFKLTKKGWGEFLVRADLHLNDDRVISLEHPLCLTKSESFTTVFKPLRPQASSGMTTDDTEQGVVRSTFLFTDGLANVGIQKAEDLCAAAQGKLGELGDRRCNLTTFGFGRDHDADLLNKLAEVGEGIYSYVESEDKIGAAFGEALGGLLSTTHQNVRVSLNLEPGVEFMKAMTTFKVDLHNNQVDIELGDLFAEERRDVLVELKLSAAEQEGAQMLGHLCARGFAVLQKRTEQSGKISLVVQRQVEVNAVAENPHVLRHQCRYWATEALEAGNAAAQRGDLATARHTLTEARDKISQSPLTQNGDPICQGLLVDLNECIRNLQYEEDYLFKGSKMMNCMRGAHGKQRACYGQDFSAEQYANSSMKLMNAQFKAHVA